MQTTMMQFQVNEEEKALIEKCVKKAGMTVSEYIRMGQAGVDALDAGRRVSTNLA